GPPGRAPVPRPERAEPRSPRVRAAAGAHHRLIPCFLPEVSMIAVPSAANSTNVRKLVPWAARVGLRVGAAVAPGWTAERAIDRFLRTSRRAPSEAAAAFRDGGEALTAEVDGRRVVARAFGEGRPVLL